MFFSLAYCAINVLVETVSCNVVKIMKMNPMGADNLKMYVNCNSYWLL